VSLPVSFDPGALDDLDAIEEYLANRFYPRNASRYVQRIVEACNAIGLAPHRGHARDDIRPGVRAVGFERRVTITFEIQADAVLILGVLYGGRQPR
jgi:toxin ParE1/3/4